MSVALLVATGCAVSSPGPTSSTADADWDRAITVTFEGDACVFDGPTRFTPGALHLTFLNDSEGYAAVNLVGLDPGYSVQDVIDYIGPEPGARHHPSWTFEKGTYYPTSAGAIYEWDGELDPGLYVIACAQSEPFGVWFGTGLEVVG